MPTVWRYALVRFTCALALVWGADATMAQEALSVTTSNRPLSVTGDRPLAPRRAAISPSHPLAWTLQFARDEQAYLHDTVRDFTCRLVKRERIDGFLQENQFIDMCVREEIRGDAGTEHPMSILLHFLGPEKVAGRRVLYIEGQNNGKMLVRNGGRHFDYVIVNVDPFSESAREESLVPITQTAFNRVLARMIDVLERHAQADPSGDNTKVDKITGAKMNSRLCTVIRVTHPLKQAGLEFHRANVFIDDELRVPVRVDFSLWPTRDGQEPPLLAEYTYTDLKLNVNLPDSTFSRAQLKGNR